VRVMSIVGDDYDYDSFQIGSKTTNCSDSSFDPSDSDWEPTSPSYSRVTREEKQETTVRRVLGQTEI